MKNYSRQREVVLQILKETQSHPTVNWIYERAREQLPKISLGTVYRNLTDFVKTGVACEINVGDGFQHFDYNTESHLHFHCKCCGTILDCEIPNDALKHHLEKTLSCRVTAEQQIFYGVCENCLREDI